MKIDGIWYRTIWEEQGEVKIIDQRALPHQLRIVTLSTVLDACAAIRDMAVRGAGLIGVTAGWGMWLAAREAPDSNFDDWMLEAAASLAATRPTAGNLRRAVERQLAAMAHEDTPLEKQRTAHRVAMALADEDALFCRRIGEHGLELIRQCYEQRCARGESDPTVHILTHCNAGWLAFVDYGSALSPVYAAYDEGIPVHVWVDETRPRNQGAALTAFELAAHGVPHDLVADNAGGHLMQHGLVDMVIVGADRVTRRGDVANKIGTYLKAVAAWDNGIPFYVALPSTSFDFSMDDGLSEIPIEERSGEEVRWVSGALQNGEVREVRICPEATRARNWAFDVTPARLVTGLLTERGFCPATEEDILRLYPEESLNAREPTEGVVRYCAQHEVCLLSSEEKALTLELSAARTLLHDMGLVGEYAEGVSYGNLSRRMGMDGRFIVSGTGTGAARQLGADGFAVVDRWIAEENRVESHGPCRPSSEAMTHGAIYAARPDANCVIHVHSPQLFHTLLRGTTPRTPKGVAYGTPAMAAAVMEVVAAMSENGLFVTAGHEDGVFVFAPSVEEAMQLLLDQIAALDDDR